MDNVSRLAIVFFISFFMVVRFPKLENQVFDGIILVSDAVQGFDAYFQVLFDELLGDLLVGVGGFDAFRYHGTVGHQQQCA